MLPLLEQLDSPSIMLQLVQVVEVQSDSLTNMVWRTQSMIHMN